MPRPKNETPKIQPGSMEEIMLRLVMHKQGEAFGRTVHEGYHETTGKDLAMTTVYTVLERLEMKGFISAEWTAPLPERGGRRKQRFAISGSGIKALQDCDEAQDRLRQKFPTPILSPLKRVGFFVKLKSKAQ